MQSITWLLLTYNRNEVVNKSISENYRKAGLDIDEIIWVDNGSENPHIPIVPTKKILFEKNKGVAKGYNAGFLLAESDFIVISGTDTIMPQDWLKSFYENRCNGIAGICDHDGLGPKIIDRNILKEIGYLREDFGLYGWDDVEFCRRCKRFGFETRRFNLEFEHIGDEGLSNYSGNDNKEYWEFKKNEAEKNEHKMREIEKNNYPYYNPYG